MKKELTDKHYWVEYYESSNTGKDEIIRICSKYDDLFDSLITSCSKPPETIIEIGAYPGRFLAYLSSRYSLIATALDFNSDKSKIVDSFAAMEGDLQEVIQADFLLHEPTKQYDLVFSNGFIEHFIDYEEVLDRHLKYLKQGGAIMIMIPNKRYIRKYYGLCVDRANLKAHNLKCMHIKVFTDFVRRNDLAINYLSYYGGFSYRVHQKLNLVQKVIYKVIRALTRRVNSFLESHPSPFYSGSIVAIFNKPNG